MTILVDTNILLDFLQRRAPHDAAAADVWRRVEVGEVDGRVSAISFNNIFYIAKKQDGAERAMEAVIAVRKVFRIVPLNERVLDRAIARADADLEDAIQAASAEDVAADYLITRDIKGCGAGCQRHHGGGILGNRFTLNCNRTSAAQPTSFAASVIVGTLASALDTGHPPLAAFACFWNAASSMPGMTASVVKSIRVIENPSPTFSNATFAEVLIRVGLKPASPRMCDSAIEKQPACAAAINSSGLVAAPSPARDFQSYG
jgi:predicted nucleic acid-binding protein